jgi:hypothetical protein
MTFWFEATRYAGSKAAVVSTATSDMNANIAFLSDSLVELALHRHYEAVPGADVFRSTELDSYADYTIKMAEVLVDLRAQKFLMDVFPGFARDDASAGSPWTRASWNGTIAWLMGQHVPYMSLNMAAMFSTPIMINTRNPTYGYPDFFFYPLSPNTTLADFETLLSEAAGEFDGLAGSNQLGRLGRGLTMSDIQYRAPQPYLSEMGQFYAFYYPAADDANTSAHSRANTGVVRFDTRIPIGACWDYGMYMFGIGTTAANDCMTLTAGAATKVNLAYGAVGDTGLTAVDDYVQGAAINQQCASWSNHQLQITAGQGFNLGYLPFKVIKTSALADETAYNNRFIRILERDVAREIWPAAGIIRHLTQGANDLTYKQQVNTFTGGSGSGGPGRAELGSHYEELSNQGRFGRGGPL